MSAYGRKRTLRLRKLLDLIALLERLEPRSLVILGSDSEDVVYFPYPRVIPGVAILPEARLKTKHRKARERLHKNNTHDMQGLVCPNRVGTR